MAITPLMSTADLYTMIGSLSSQLKAAGAKPVISPDIALGKIERPGNITPVGFDPKSIAQAAVSGVLPGPKGIFGHIKSDAQHLLPELSDVLSRGQYASANIAHGVENDVANIAKHPDVKTILNMVANANPESLVASHPHELVSGLAGTKKGNYGEVIQHGADLLKENGNVAKAEANPGVAHVNPFVKGIGGLIGDIALDPTSYLGTGLAGKVVDAPKIAENLAKTAEVGEDAKRLEYLGKSTDETPTDIANQLGARVKGLVGKTNKRSTFLTQKQVDDAIKGASETKDSLIPKLARRYSVETWASAQAEAEKEFPRLAANSTHAERNIRNLQIAKRAKELTNGLDEKGLERAKTGEITELMRANLKPETARSLGVTFGGSRILHIPYESLAQKAFNLKAGDSALGKSMATFKNAFSTGLPDDLKSIVSGSRGVESQVTRQSNHDLVGLYGKTSKEDLGRIVNSVRDGSTHTTVIAGATHPNLVEHFANGVNDLEKSIPKSVRTMGEINHFLAPKFRLPTGAASKLDSDFLHQTLRKQAGESDKDLNNPAHLLFYYQHALQQAKTVRAMRETIGHELGHAITNEDGTANVTTQVLRRMGYRKALTKGGSTIPYLENHVFDPETAAGVERLHSMLSAPGTTNQLLRTYDGAMRIWKSAITKYNPGYHERNLMGDVFNNFLAGVHDLRDYRDAGKVLHGRTTRFYGPGGSDLDGKKIITLRKPIVVDGIKTTHLSADQVWKLYVDSGLKTGWLTTEFGKGIDRETSTGITKVLHMANSGVQKGTEDIEDFSRLTHFIHLLKSGTPADKAGQEVRKFHFDYSDFTPFERKVMTRAFPFYKWTRKNIPLMLERTFATPGKVLAIPKTERALSTILGYPTGDHVLPQGDAIAPDWLRKDMAFPVGGWGTNGDTVYDDPPLPWQQAFETLEQPKDTAGQMSNPIFQLAVEALTGKTTQGYAAGGVGKTIENQTPYTRLLANIAHSGTTGKSNKVSLAQFLSGLGLVENTPKSQQETLFFANGGR